MEVQLQELIEQIKKEGVEAAETEAKTIVDAARAEAQKILSDAQTQAEKILANAKAENDRIVKSSEDAIRQAGRNLLISFRESVARELRAILSEQVTAVYSSEAFVQLIIKVVEGFAAKPETEDVTVILNPDDLRAMESLLVVGLKDRMEKGVTLKANDHVDVGFRIAINGDGAYYDYSAEEIVEMLSHYLSPRVTELLKEAE